MAYVLKCDACGYVGSERPFYEVAKLPETLSPIRPQAPTHICIECLGPKAVAAAERAAVEIESRVAQAEQEVAGFRTGGLEAMGKRR